MREYLTRGRRLRNAQIAEIHRLLGEGGSIAAVAVAVGEAYGTVYDVATGRTHGRGRIVPERGNLRLRPAERDALYQLKRDEKLSDSALAAIHGNGVSRATINRAMREAKLVFAARVRRVYLSTSRPETCARFGLSPEELDELLTLISEHKLSKRLAREVRS